MQPTLFTRPAHHSNKRVLYAREEADLFLAVGGDLDRVEELHHLFVGRRHPPNDDECKLQTGFGAS